MADEGALTLRLAREAGRVSRVELSSSRRTDFSTVLVGLPVGKALGLVPSLFSICASAQAVAGLEGCEAAMGLEVDEGNHALRRALVALEALDNHTFQFFVEWPKVVGLPPDVAAFRKVRAACQSVRAALIARTTGWARPGGVPVEAGVADVAALRSAVEAAIPHPLEADEVALGRWSPFLAAAVVAGAGRLGQGKSAPLPLEDASWFAQRLTGAAFSATPTVDGAPAEAGSLCYVESMPAMAPVLARAGRTVWARLLGQLANAHRLLDVLEAELPRVATGRSARGGARAQGAGAGAGVADTSRGRLAHAVELEGGVVTSWRTVAPTEWTFHPQGVVPQVLEGLRSEEAEALAPFLVAGLDPCVACVVRR